MTQTKAEAEAAFKATWITEEELRVMIGTLLFKEKVFSGNTGGAPALDSFRGFGSTSQRWNVPTTNGWIVYYDDNSGREIVNAKSPDRSELWIHEEGEYYALKSVREAWLASEYEYDVYHHMRNDPDTRYLGVVSSHYASSACDKAEATFGIPWTEIVSYERK